MVYPISSYIPQLHGIDCLFCKELQSPYNSFLPLLNLIYHSDFSFYVSSFGEILTSPFPAGKVRLLPISLTVDFSAVIANNILIVFSLTLDSEGRNHCSFIYQNINNVWHMGDD